MASATNEYGLDILIHSAYLSCVESFLSCWECPNISTTSRYLIDEEISRFNIWAANIGAHLDPANSLSLDYRLRNSDRTRKSVVLLLRVLRVNIDYATRIFDESDDTLYATLSQTNVARSLENQVNPPIVTAKDIAVSLSNEALASVHVMVGQLKRMSTAIKRASTAAYDLRAARDRDSKDDTDKSADHEKFARNIVKYKLKDASGSVPESLVNTEKALTNGVEFRMRRFADWERHHKRRLSRERKMVRAQALRMDRPFLEDEYQEAYTQATETGDACEKVSIDKPIQAQSTVTSRKSFESKLFEQPSSASHQTNVSASVRSIMGNTYIDWPRPPKIALSASRSEKIECPYCYDQLEIGEVTNKTKWRKHVKRDLEPYNCLEEECQQYLKMFSSEEQWVKHIEAHHSRGIWICRLQPHKKAESFTEQSAVRQHLEAHHTGMFPKSRVETLIKSMYRSDESNLFQECPLDCIEQPSVAEPDRLTHHVANHLLSLAMDSLPERSVASSQSSFSEDEDHSGGSSAAKTDVTVQEGLNKLPHLDFDLHEDKETGLSSGMRSIIDGFQGLNSQQDIFAWLESLEQDKHTINAEIAETSSVLGRPDSWKTIYLVHKFRLHLRKLLGLEALSIAASRGDVLTVRRLIHKGVGVNFRGVNREPALIQATRGRQEETVELLLESGANPDVRGKLGETALVHAASNGNRTIVRLLCAYDADMGESGRQALISAAEKRDEEMVQLLLSYGARFKAADIDLRPHAKASVPIWGSESHDNI